MESTRSNLLFFLFWVVPRRVYDHRPLHQLNPPQQRTTPIHWNLDENQEGERTLFESIAVVSIGKIRNVTMLKICRVPALGTTKSSSSVRSRPVFILPVLISVELLELMFDDDVIHSFISPPTSFPRSPQWQDYCMKDCKKYLLQGILCLTEDDQSAEEGAEQTGCSSCFSTSCASQTLWRWVFLACSSNHQALSRTWYQNFPHCCSECQQHSRNLVRLI